MNLTLTEEQQLIQDTARDFATTVLAPAATKVAVDRALFLTNLKSLAELGFMGLNVSERYGGTEAGVVAFSLAITEIAKVCASTAVTVSVNNMVAEVIESIANEEQKTRYLPLLCSGEFAAGGFCLTEASAGSDPAGMRCSASRDGDSWILNGSKLYITSLYGPLPISQQKRAVEFLVFWSTLIVQASRSLRRNTNWANMLRRPTK